MKLVLTPWLLGATPDLPLSGRQPQVLAALAVSAVMAAVLMASVKRVDFRPQRADQAGELNAQIRSALHLAETAAARVRSDYTTEDGLTVVPSSTSRNAASLSRPERGEIAGSRPRRRGETLAESGAVR